MFKSGKKRILSALGSAAGVLLILSATPVLMCGCGKDRPAEELLNEAVQHGQAGQWEDCEKCAVEVLKDKPDNASALLLRAIAAENLGQKEVALESAKQASENAPGDFSAQYTYGRMLAQYPEKTKNAIQVLKRARELNRNHASTLLLLGQCSLRINSADAIGYFRMLPQELRETPEVRTCMAIYYIGRIELDPRSKAIAMEALFRAYQAAPEDPVVILNMAFFLDQYYRRDRKGREKAISFYRRYLLMTANNPELNPTRAQVQQRISKLRY